MVISERARFWLKVVLTVTCPLWALPFCLALMAASIGLVIWGGVSDMVDGPKNHDEADE